MRPSTLAAALVALAVLVPAPTALADFPWAPGAEDPTDFSQLRVPAGADQGPDDLRGANVWKFAATPDPSPASAPNNADPAELGGVRGGHVFDNADVDSAWRTTTGRPDVTIAVLDSGIQWNDRRAMVDLRKNTRLSRGEAGRPRNDGLAEAREKGVSCDDLATDGWDLNRDGVFNVVDYACDSRVSPAPALGVGPKDLLDPQDVLIAFSDGVDDDDNGYVDDMVGWDFLDDDNDPFDDVQYGHGTGEAEGSVGEANNAAEKDADLGTCPNCTAIHLRVGDSFIADVNRFAQAVVYAVDNDALVVQEALGTLNNSTFARQAVEYAYRHGVAVIASAADEAAQHNNWPSSLPHVILVNSVTKFDEALTPSSRSYLQFNGCTNFNSKITVAIPSTSCSSDATGVGSGMAGLVYSAALNAHEKGRLEPHPDCRRTDGRRCLITANEVRQLMASGRVGDREQADDVNFAVDPATGRSIERSCHPLPTPGCTDPFAAAPPARPVVSPLVTTRRYPARKGHDQFYGYGRINTDRAVDRAAAGELPPEVEITSPEWYALIDPSKDAFTVEGEIFARDRPYVCRVLVAPGAYPHDDPTTTTPAGDFQPVSSQHCDGSTPRRGSFRGALAGVDVADLKERFPKTAGGFDGREPGLGAQLHNGRPNTAPYGFVVKVEATTVGSTPMTGRDRRQMFLHRDRHLLPGFPRELGGDGESSPLFVDLDGDNANELVFGSSDGTVHALRRDGRHLRGWPVRTDRQPIHTGGRAYRTGEVRGDWGGAVITAPAAGDLDRDGDAEVVVADLEGKVYAFDGRGERVLEVEANPAYSGKPLEPFVNVRQGETNRTQHGFLASPVLADIDRDDGGRLEILAAGMDRHLYAWNDDGTAVDGYPILVVDRSKVATIDERTHAVTFKEGVGADLQQGPIIATPAVANLVGDENSPPEIVVGTNEEYREPLNASPLSNPVAHAAAQSDLLSPANGRLHAFDAGGEPLDGWPVPIGILQAELLPVVGEGINGSPVVAPLQCPEGGTGAKIGVIPAAGVGYVLNADGSSCFGRDGDHDRALDNDTGNPGLDATKLAAVGLPAFGDLGGGQPSFLAPVAGIVRALDVAVNEYQGGTDAVGAWDTRTGRFRPGWPAVVNDLQFLTGPSVADIDGVPGEEVVAGTSSMDLAAFDAAGLPADADWPKLTGDWTVTTPAIGAFGDGRRKVVVSMTRRGSVLAYETRAPVCSPGSSPRFHHDNANSGDYTRDAVAPGTPTDLHVENKRLTFTAPGDDLLCGRAARFEVVRADGRITGRRFNRLDPVAVEATVDGKQTASVPLPPGKGRRVAIRAVDEQGNVGRVASLRLGR